MKLTLQQLEAHLWGAANILRGKTAGQDYKNYILSLMFYKRLCDQWECEADDAIAEQERQQGRAFSEKEKAVFRKRGEHRFQIPDGGPLGTCFEVTCHEGLRHPGAEYRDRIATRLATGAAAKHEPVRLPRPRMARRLRGGGEGRAGRARRPAHGLLLRPARAGAGGGVGLQAPTRRSSCPTRTICPR